MVHLGLAIHLVIDEFGLLNRLEVASGALRLHGVHYGHDPRHLLRRCKAEVLVSAVIVRLITKALGLVRGKATRKKLEGGKSDY